MPDLMTLHTLKEFYSKEGEFQGLDIWIRDPDNNVIWIGSRRTIEQCAHYLDYLGIVNDIF